jgi:hypothetical protein
MDSAGEPVLLGEATIVSTSPMASSRSSVFCFWSCG